MKIKLKQNSKQQLLFDEHMIAYQEKVFEPYFNLAKQSNLVSNSTFINQAKLILNYSEKIERFQKIWTSLQDAVSSKKTVIFDSFKIIFTRDFRFSLVNLIPNITYLEAPNNVSSVAFTSEFLEERNEYFDVINSLIDNIVLKLKNPLEILPGLILFYDYGQSNIKLVFSPDFLGDEFKKVTEQIQ
ncbi:MSC_0623 family F1-like ATPase-associated protein [Mycoplasmopsis sturni]|uniref:MSC_0623 family F1-like ATPase-associated protein n=1 Tax=Mycoplasmopsis sturni TaxID=39047 RepID=UPI000566219C|nr:DUF2714 domain-containing protein [Mycoplasmopsis sturni]